MLFTTSASMMESMPIYCNWKTRSLDLKILLQILYGRKNMLLKMMQNGLVEIMISLRFLQRRNFAGIHQNYPVQMTKIKCIKILTRIPEVVGKQIIMHQINRPPSDQIYTTLLFIRNLAKRFIPPRVQHGDTA